MIFPQFHKVDFRDWQYIKLELFCVIVASDVVVSIKSLLTMTKTTTLLADSMPNSFGIRSFRAFEAIFLKALI